MPSTRRGAGPEGLGCVGWWFFRGLKAPCSPGVEDAGCEWGDFTSSLRDEAIFIRR